MLEFSRLDGSRFLLNAHMILMVEARPDTVITLTDGKHVVVKESVDEVAERMLAYQQRVHQGCCSTARIAQEASTNG